MALKNIVALGAYLAAGALAQLGETPVQATDPGFDSFPDCVNGPVSIAIHASSFFSPRGIVGRRETLSRWC